VKRLFNFKQWLTVPEAARHLSILLGEDLSEADILRLALDRQLTLSIHFVNHVICRIGLLVETTETALELDHFDSGQTETYFIVEAAADGQKIKRIDWSQENISFTGVWDLSILGCERELEQRYRALTNNPAIQAPQSGAVERPILRGPDGSYYQIIEGFSGPQALPEDSIFVVRTSALRDLEARISEPEERAEKPLGERERRTLLVIIAALAKMADIDVTKPSKAAVAIESQTIDMGARISTRAMEDHLKRIPSALEALKN
jgi:hypothetical protein